MDTERLTVLGIDVERADGSSPSSLDKLVRRLIDQPDVDRFLNSEQYFFALLTSRLRDALDDGFDRRADGALGELHRALYLLYEQNFAAPTTPQALNQFHPFPIRIRREIERAWQAFETNRARLIVDAIPADPFTFAEAFRQLCVNHPLSRHPLFDFLEFKAKRDDLVAFMQRDSALILRFSDLVAMAMIGADDEVRGELATNLWDEMGNGDLSQRHTNQFRNLLAYVNGEAVSKSISSLGLAGLVDWQGLAGYNLHLFFSLHRTNYLKSVGCLGASELMDAAQYAKLLRGCARVGLDDQKRLAYYTNHVDDDLSHGETWLTNVIVPLVCKYPHHRSEIMLGAEMRLNVTCDYFTSVLRHLVGTTQTISVGDIGPDLGDVQRGRT